MPRPQPTPGHPIARHGKPYIYATWLAKILGGQQCLWSAWFKAHYQHAKFETEADKLVEWNREHNALMRQVRADLEENGWRCAVEGENDFRLEGASAIVAGKPDLIATMPGHVLVVDGKTGRRRDSDIWQVLIYLFAIVRGRSDLVGDLRGEVVYKDGQTIGLRQAELSEARIDDMARMVKIFAADQPPAKVPSQYECRRCNIGPVDCPQRFKEDRELAAAAVADF